MTKDAFQNMQDAKRAAEHISAQAALSRYVKELAVRAVIAGGEPRREGQAAIGIGAGGMLALVEP
jgi:hypothetical protein